MSGLLAAAAARNGSGYLYELLRLLGASPGTAQHVQDLLLRPVTVVVILVVAGVVAHLGSSTIKRSLHSLRARAEARSDARREAAGEGGGRATRLETVVGRIEMFGRIAANLWRVVVWVIAILSILGVLGIDLAPFVAGATVIGATIGFGAQTLVKDYLSGFLLLAEDQYRVGDSVATASATGVVEEMTLRVTRLKGDDGTVWYVPNGDIRTLGNTSRASASSHVDVLVPIGPSLEQVGRIVEEAARTAVGSPPLERLCTEPPSLLGIEDMDGVTATFRLALHTLPGAAAPVARAVRAAVTGRLVEAGMLGSALSTPEGPPAPAAPADQTPPQPEEEPPGG